MVAQGVLALTGEQVVQRAEGKTSLFSCWLWPFETLLMGHLGIL